MEEQHLPAAAFCIVLLYGSCFVWQLFFLFIQMLLERDYFAGIFFAVVFCSGILFFFTHLCLGVAAQRPHWSVVPQFLQGVNHLTGLFFARQSKQATGCTVEYIFE